MRGKRVPWAFVVVFFFGLLWQRYEAGEARLEARAARDSIAVLDSVYAGISESVAEARVTADSLARTLEIRRLGWADERDRLVRERRAAQARAGDLQTRVQNQAPPDLQPMLDSLAVAHQHEVDALDSRITRLIEQVDLERLAGEATGRLAERQDSAIYVLEVTITQKDRLIEAQASELRAVKRGRWFERFAWLAAGVALVLR